MSLDSILYPFRDRQVRGRIENIDIADLILNEYELLTYSQQGFLRFNEIGHSYNHSHQPMITPDHINIVQHGEEGVEWNFNVESLGVGIDAGTIQSASRQTTYKDKYKIRHEFVAEAINRSGTDKRLLEVFDEERDEDDNLTPDFVWVDHRGFYHVIEVTTTRNNTEEGVSRAYNMKAFKYKFALEARAMRNKVVTFSVIVVSQDYVLSSIALPRALMSELIVRMRIGLALENKAKSLGFSFESDEGDLLQQALFESISNHIKGVSYKIPNEHELTINSQYVESLCRKPSEEDCLSVYLKSINMAKDESQASRAKSCDPESVLDAFYKELRGPNRKVNIKPVINLPLFLPTPTKSSVDVPDICLNHEHSCIESKLWSIALDDFQTERVRNIDEDPLFLIQEAMETDVIRIKEYQGIRKSNRSKYHRVNIMGALSSLEKECLAEQGLWAKKFRGDTFYKERRAQSQRFFSLDTYTNDIDYFLDDASVFESVDEKFESRPNEYILRLLGKANEIVGNSSKGLEVVRKWMSTKLFRALDLISDIGMELCISNKQNCKTGSGIVKKLRYHDAYLLIFPTKSSEHTFFTLYFPSGKPLCDLPFRKLVKISQGYVSTLVSVKQSKLENWCSASASLIALSAFWSWFYELDSDGPSNFLSKKEPRAMLLLSILIRLEDKAQTEETITLMRYMYMESFKGLITPNLANPFKVLPKISTRVRSRLNLWVIKKTTKNFLTMILHPPSRHNQTTSELIEGEDSLPRDTWTGLLNCFTGAQVLSASKVINLVYLGYLKNKNESPEGNTDFQLIEKTLEEEFKLDITNLDRSKGIMPSDAVPKGKQFDKNCIMFGSYLMEKKLEASLGRDWKSRIGEEIIANLTSSMTETIATLKASSTVKHSESPGYARYDEPKSALRCKVIEAVSEKLSDFGLNPFTKLESFIDYIETTSKGVIADLFKKQQHGGLREIYVLTIESRIVQLFLEVISRTICSYFDEETLTHPKNKLRKLNEHRRLGARLSQKRNCLSVDLCSSNDKTRWNQNFVMPAMCIPLLRMTPKSFHNCIIRIMNLWSNKLIKIPQSVCIHLLNRTKFSSSIFNDMMDLFWSPQSKPGVNIFDHQMSNCLRLRTGMMQGILHYTSSLLHLTFLHSSNRIIPMVLKNWFPACKFTMTQICSSDDSAAMLTVLGPEDGVQLDHQFIKTASYASICLESLAITCKYFCMQESMKSTNSLIDYVEFNSEFMFCNTIAMPVVKFVAASLNLTESESFLERFYTQYNLTSDLFSSGLTAEHTHLCQLAQGMMHYKSMGSSTNALFREWGKRIIAWPDPKYGFFLLDLDLMPGVLGYAYAHWAACVRTPIFQGTIKDLNNEAWVTTPDGGITQSLIIKHGEVKRWKTLVARVKGSTDIHDTINKDPSLLFRAPETISELQIKLAIQATSPGVSKSMRRGNPFMQSIAMSVYAINTHAFSKTTVTQEHNKRVKQTDKVCILGELDRMISSPLGEQRDFESSLLLAFPNKHRYEELQQLINQMRRSVLVSCHRFRERKNEVIIQPRSAQLPLSLKQVLMTRWFGMPIKASHKIYVKCLDIYRATIPWLADDIRTCLQESPFTTYQELYNFVSSSLEKTRTFRRNGPGLHSKRLTGQLYNLIRKSQRPCTILREQEKRHHLIPSTDLITKINLGLSIPNSTFRRSMVLETLRCEPAIYDDLGSIAMMQRREATLAYIQGVEKGDFSLDEVAIHMRDLGLGTHISYIQEQRRVMSPEGIKWIGEGVCFLFIESCQVELVMKDDKLLRARVDNWKRLRSNMYSFNQVIRDMKLTPTLDSGRQYGVVARYNGTHLVSSEGVGCPIYGLGERERVKFDPASLVLRVDQGEIKLVQKVRSVLDGRVLYEICMLKYRMNHNDILLSHKAECDEKDVWKAWINQQSCCPDTLFGLIKRAIKDKHNPICIWLKETLQARLQFKNLGSFSIRYYDTVTDSEERENGVDEEEEAILQMIREGKFDLGERVMQVAAGGSAETVTDWAEEASRELEMEEKAALAALGELGMSHPLPLWTDYVKNWLEFPGEVSSSVLGPAYGSFLSVHPLWDSVINGFLEERQDFWYELIDGKTMTGFEKVSADLMSLLEIKPKLATSGMSMSDRYKVAREFTLVGSPEEEVFAQETDSSTIPEVSELGLDIQAEHSDSNNGTSDDDYFPEW